MSGLLLAGDGKGSFTVSTSSKTGFVADKDVKGLAELFLADGSSLVLVANNNADMDVYKMNKKPVKVFSPLNNEIYAIIEKKSGRLYRQELYHGNNYLSQASGKIKISDAIRSVSFYDAYGHKRIVQ